MLLSVLLKKDVTLNLVIIKTSFHNAVIVYLV